AGLWTSRNSAAWDGTHRPPMKLRSVSTPAPAPAALSWTTADSVMGSLPRSRNGTPILSRRERLSPKRTGGRVLSPHTPRQCWGRGDLVGWRFLSSPALRAGGGASCVATRPPSHLDLITGSFRP